MNDRSNRKVPWTRQAPPVCRFSWPKGISLKPVPPIGQFKDVRSLDVRESDKIDEKQLATWIKQAASIPGWDSGSTRYGGSTTADPRLELAAVQIFSTTSRER